MMFSAAGEWKPHFTISCFPLSKKGSLVHLVTAPNHLTLIHQPSTCLGTLFSFVFLAWYSTPIHLFGFIIFLILFITFTLMSSSPDAAGS